ncbi:type II toxin-antitoxin system PemK/MazF family toxin [Mitsuokella jalaludinii]|uniref:type II toxin-antitoxin system PemK/MazF family toxin n=1 Tax=Mitsuokella jalaludinii TaxID=187979 RepID=UPI0026DD1E79|nr:type II toxin-antitoxin system PemK/MazF family toxin [uncultured Mitsuokella sp.]
MNQYPHARDIILLDFDPQSGHEIKKKRPALVISNDAFNKLTGLAMVCPITSTHRDIPLHVSLDTQTNTHGDILCEQVKSLDYRARNWKFLERCPQELFDKALFIVNAILGE